MKVLDAALELVDRVGVDGLSMRKLGVALGVEAMTLYHYVPNKDALLSGLVERTATRAFTVDPRAGAQSLSDRTLDPARRRHHTGDRLGDADRRGGDPG